MLRLLRRLLQIRSEFVKFRLQFSAGAFTTAAKFWRYLKSAVARCKWTYSLNERMSLWCVQHGSYAHRCHGYDTNAVLLDPLLNNRYYYTNFSTSYSFFRNWQLRKIQKKVSKLESECAKEARLSSKRDYILWRCRKRDTAGIFIIPRVPRVFLF